MSGGLPRSLRLAPIALIAVAEASWIFVVGALMQEFTLRDPVIGIPALAGFVVAGLVLARLGVSVLHERWPIAAIGLMALATVGGVLVSETARSELAAGVGPSIAAHPGGLVAGLALLRGFAYERQPLAESTISHLLIAGVPGIAVVSMVGGVIGEPLRSRFLGDCLGAAVVFISSTVLALALARLDEHGSDAGFDWRGNPGWLALTIAVLVGAVALALPLSLVAGTVISTLISLAMGPFLVLGIYDTFNSRRNRLDLEGLERRRPRPRRSSRRLVALLGLAAIATYLFTGNRIPTLSGADSAVIVGPDAPTTAERIFAVSLGGVLLVLGVAAILVLVAIWMKRSPAPAGVLDEVRSIEPWRRTPASSRPRRAFWRRSEPVDAAAAYVALVDELARHAPVRREAAETPAAHAARLRAQGDAGLSLELLAADYALARYGGTTLTAREDRRGVARWRLLRRDLADISARRIKAKAAASAPETEMPVDMEPRRNVQA